MPLSECLQRKGLDQIKAWNMMQIARSSLRKKSQELDDIHTAGRSFAERVNDEFKQFAKFPVVCNIKVDLKKCESKWH